MNNFVFYFVSKVRVNVGGKVLFLIFRHNKYFLIVFLHLIIEIDHLYLKCCKLKKYQIEAILN